MQGRLTVENLTKSMDDVSIEQLSLGCNRDFRPLHRSLSQMVGVLDALLQASNRAISLLRCEKIVPVYTTFVYDGTCKYSVSGFTWIFACLFIVSCCGMIMIMFRSSYQNTVYEAAPTLMDESSSIRHSRRSGDSNAPSRKKSERFEDEE